MKELWKNFIKFITSRLFIIFIVIIGLFYFLVLKLFELQIVEGEKHQRDLKASILRSISIPAPRGTIYDKYGRPLAINNVAYSVKVDNSVKIDDKYKNQMYMNLIRQIEANGDNINPIINELPISTTRPYTFTFNNIDRELAWKNQIYTKGIKSKISTEEKNKILSSITAEQMIEYLKELFKIDPKLNDEDSRKLISLRYAIYLKRYFQYQPITIALDVSEKTVALLEEKNDEYPSVYIETEALRIYPEKGLFSHILGYTRAMDISEFYEYKKYIYVTDEAGNTQIQKVTTDEEIIEDSKVYSSNDIVGKTGLEKSFEIELNGIAGKEFVEVDPNGRKINTIDTQKEPEPGKKIYLTIDRDLQEATTTAMIEELKNALLLKLDPKGTKNTFIPLKDFFSSIVNANRISIKDILNSEENTYQSIAKNLLLNNENYYEFRTEEDFEYAKQILIDGIQLGEISSKQMILIMHEQGMITGDEDFIKKVTNGTITPLDVIKDKIMNDEITPQDAALDPCSGSVVVSDIHTGEVLAMVTYPTYDNNEFVNHFNYEYYKKQQDDPTSPLINRPLMQSKAPGSTFKMITAIAGLEENVINSKSIITDLSIFEKAGNPGLRCWIHPGSHNSINVVQALEVSCNYFFNEVVYRMGNASMGNRLDSIETLNKYMTLFGLNSFTGVEIGEAQPRMASPEYKKIAIENVNPEVTSSQTRWTDGDTIRASIGQSYNSYTVANMAKYVATLANGGTRYQMQLVDKIKNVDNSIYLNKQPVVEEFIELNENNFKTVYEGMYAVTKGSKGTLKSKFKDYPIEVAAKTGTAQEAKTRDSHTWVVAFAPFDEPQISVAVMIPFGDITTYPAAEVLKKVISFYMGLDYKSEIKTMDNMLSM